MKFSSIYYSILGYSGEKSLDEQDTPLIKAASDLKTFGSGNFLQSYKKSRNSS